MTATVRNWSVVLIFAAIGWSAGCTCAGGSASTPDATSADAAGFDAPDAHSEDATSGDAQRIDAATHDADAWPYFVCCQPGEGVDCCPPGSIPEPGSGRTAWCFQYGGVLGECTVEDAQLEARDICSVCCNGLVRVDTIALATPDDRPDATFEQNGHLCVRSGLFSLFWCTACGDGHCRGEENGCNCPSDCP